MNDTRVLIVDDEKLSRLALMEFLKAAGYAVTTVGRASDALSAQREAPFDVCVVDLRVPDMDGTQIILKLHAISPHSQFILYTGSADFVLSPVLKALGMASRQVVRKPIFNMEAFVDLVGDLAKRPTAAHRAAAAQRGALTDTDPSDTL